MSQQRPGNNKATSHPLSAPIQAKHFFHKPEKWSKSPPLTWFQWPKSCLLDVSSGCEFWICWWTYKYILHIYNIICKYRCELNEILMPFTYQKGPNLDLYIYLKLNSPKQGLFQPRQGSFGFQVNIFHIYNIIYTAVSANTYIYIYMYAHMFYEYHLLSFLLYKPHHTSVIYTWHLIWGAQFLFNPLLKRWVLYIPNV